MSGHTERRTSQPTDEMVDAACEALPNFGHPNGYVTRDMLRDVLEAALTVASCPRCSAADQPTEHDDLREAYARNSTLEPRWGDYA